MERSSWALVVSIVIVFAYWTITLFFPGILSPVYIAYLWFLDVSLVIGYPGAFVVCLLGNAAILVPFPYIGVPFILAGLTDSSGQFLFDPWVVGIVSGIGAAIGEMTGYLLGIGGGELVQDEEKEGFRQFIEKHPRATPLLVWFLAITPIADDVLIISLGAVRYPLWKVVIPQLLGKCMFLIAIALSGRIGLQIIDGLIGGLGKPTILTRSIEAVGILIFIVLIYLIMRKDWSVNDQTIGSLTLESEESSSP